jgi:hypothetical protein
MVREPPGKAPEGADARSAAPELEREQVKPSPW